MVVSWTAQRFPKISKQIKALARKHRGLKGEPLHLAIAYAPQDDSDDVVLFEVVGGLGLEEVSPEKDLFKVSFESSPALQMETGQQLHIVLTNPTEAQVAVKQQWPLLSELRRALQRGSAEVLYKDKEGGRLMELLR